MLPNLGGYNIVYADPPWRYNGALYDRGGAENHYVTMTTEDIANMPIKNITADNCVLFMWATFPKLQDAFVVMRGWGFDYKTCAFVWVKTNRRVNVRQYSFLPQEQFDSFMGMGKWTRANAEICLLGVRGKIERKNAGIHQIIYAPIEKHSKKPDIVRKKIIELVGDMPKVELFARQNRDGWDAFGNECETSIDIGENLAI